MILPLLLGLVPGAVGLAADLFGGKGSDQEISDVVNKLIEAIWKAISPKLPADIQTAGPAILKLLEGVVDAEIEKIKL